METIFITGATGILGRILKTVLSSHYEVSVLKSDITNEQELLSQIPSNASVVIHLAALVPVDTVNSNRTHAYEVNVAGTLNLVKCLNKLKIQPYLFYASSSHVYQPSNLPIAETDQTNPQNTYARTKLIAEQIIEECYNGRFCIGRIFSYYSEHQREPFLYPTIRRRLETENLSQPFELFGADSFRDFLTADAVCQYIACLLKPKPTGILNIGSGKGIKIRDFVQSLTPHKLNITGLGANNSLIANVNKLHSIL